VTTSSGLPMRRGTASLPAETPSDASEFPQIRPGAQAAGAPDAAVPTALIFRCRRCGDTVATPHSAPRLALLRAITRRQTLTAHECDDGASGLADLIGTGPGRARCTGHDGKTTEGGHADC